MSGKNNRNRAKGSPRQTGNPELERYAGVHWGMKVAIVVVIVLILGIAALAWTQMGRG